MIWMTEFYVILSRKSWFLAQKGDVGISTHFCVSREIWETASFCKQSLHYARGSVSLSCATIPHSSWFPKSWWYTLMLIRKNYYFIGTQIKDIVGDKIRTRVQGLELKLLLDSQSRFYSYFWVLEVSVVSMKTGCRSSHSTLNSR